MAHEHWTCPVCRLINRVLGEYSAAGFCQSGPCVDRRAFVRDIARTMGEEPIHIPELHEGAVAHAR